MDLTRLYGDEIHMLLSQRYISLTNDAIQVHQNRMCPFLQYSQLDWYGPKQKGLGRPPKWIETHLSDKEWSVQEQVGNNSAGAADD